MDVDQESLQYLQNLVRDAEYSPEAAYLLRKVVETHVEGCDTKSLVKIAFHIMNLCEKQLEAASDPFGD